MASFVVFDFDGTVTLSEEEGEAFTRAYLGHLSSLTGLGRAELEGLAATLSAEMLATPQAWPFRYAGRAVAPASVDPYLRMSAFAERLFADLGIFRDVGDRGRLLNLLYPLNYQLTVERPIFRDDAMDTFRALADANLYIVTNSRTEHVGEKLRRLGERAGEPLEWLAARARGDARKFIIDDAFDRVPEGMELPGLDRPVLLRRGHYHGVLDAIRSAHDADWSEGWVVGDIFELDLALPLALGMNVALVAGPSTPAYERAFVEGALGPDGARRGHVVDSLTDVLRRLGR